MEKQIDALELRLKSVDELLASATPGTDEYNKLLRNYESLWDIYTKAVETEQRVEERRTRLTTDLEKEEDNRRYREFQMEIEREKLDAEATHRKAQYKLDAWKIIAGAIGRIGGAAVNDIPIWQITRKEDVYNEPIGGKKLNFCAKKLMDDKV